MSRIASPEDLDHLRKTEPKPVACTGDMVDGTGCHYLETWMGGAQDYHECPWRSWQEGKALCLLATPEGRYSYSEMADAFGTEYRCAKGSAHSADEVAVLLGIGKHQVTAIENRAIKKLGLSVRSRDRLPPNIREAAAWIFEMGPAE